jgi:hypothetical protein
MLCGVSIRCVLLLLVVGCPLACKNPSPTTTSASATTTPSAPPVGARAAVDGGTHEVGATIESVVRAWNTAINAHDASKLGTLYADQVELYGQVMAKERATALKKVAFGNHVRDEISNIVVDEAGRASFRKKSTLRNGKTIDVQGYLDVDHGTITSEGDTTTDKNLLRARGVTCEDAMLRLVLSTAEARRAMDEIADAGVSVGGMVFPPSNPSQPWDVAVCENYAERMPCYHHFDVSPASGTVKYSTDGDTPIKTDAALLAAMHTACAR